MAERGAAPRSSRLTTRKRSGRRNALDYARVDDCGGAYQAVCGLDDLCPLATVPDALSRRADFEVEDKLKALKAKRIDWTFLRRLERPYVGTFARLQFTSHHGPRDTGGISSAPSPAPLLLLGAVPLSLRQSSTRLVSSSSVHRRSLESLESRRVSTLS